MNDTNDQGWTMDCPECGHHQANLTEDAWGDPPICPKCGENASPREPPESEPDSSDSLLNKVSDKVPTLVSAVATDASIRDCERLHSMLNDIFSGRRDDLA